jgi:trimeric autotransporter adhesin
VAVTSCNSLDKCVGIPRAFTPNGDGINDAIGPLANGCEIKDLLFQVYNRFGQKVFETTNLSKKWDGKIKGAEQPVGVYVYICSFISNGNEKNSVKGNFLLLR